jgi:hypothetical protein
MVYFQTKNTNFWVNFGLGMEKVGIFNGQLEFLGAMLYFKWTFGSILFVVFVHFPPFGTLCQEKSGSPASHPLFPWSLVDLNVRFRGD